MRPTLVLNVVGLTSELLGEHTPHLSALAASGAQRHLRAITPAVTCSAQATYLTGLLPSGHGIVGNGWYFRDLCEVMFWRQSNRLVQGEKVWERGRRGDSAFTTAKMFWWYNMYSSAEWSATPRPQYPADGRKIPDFYAQPSELHRELQERLGTFPLFRFWGPGADIACSEWIARASLYVFETKRPTLTLVYLPHLDYNLQRLGPRHPDLKQDLRAVDALCGELIDAAKKRDASVVVLSEYGIVEVSRPVHPNRALREAGLLAVREEQHGETLDAGASEAFAVADHQIAHVYVKHGERVAEVAELLRGLPGVGVVLGDEDKRVVGLDHPRAGELVLVSDPDAWFTYYFWLDDARAPDYARTVDIHRKPGYDPVELFFDPKLPLPKLKVGWTLLSRKLGSRALLDVIGLDASLVRGSHGRVTDDLSQGPVLLSSDPEVLPPEDVVEAVDVQQILLDHVFGRGEGSEKTIVEAAPSDAKLSEAKNLL